MEKNVRTVKYMRTFKCERTVKYVRAYVCAHIEENLLAHIKASACAHSNVLVSSLKCAQVLIHLRKNRASVNTRKTEQV